MGLCLLLFAQLFLSLKVLARKQEFYMKFLLGVIQGHSFCCELQAGKPAARDCVHRNYNNAGWPYL